MGEGIHQQAGDGAIQIGQARDVTLNLVTGITRLPTDYASRIRNFLTEYLSTPEQPVPFGGRDADLDRLDTWLADSHAPPYLLLAAPAGRGKSALLVRWSQRLLAQNDISLVFVPVSIRFRTNLAPVVFAALAARLAHLHGEEVPQTTDLTAEQWRGLVSTYLARSLPDRRSLVLILDGVDEAADWEPGPDLFPLAPPSGLRIIVSTRYRAGDADAAPWLRRLGWERPGLARALDLDPLARAGVADVLQKMGFPLDVLARDVDIVTELHRLSEGDPLLVRLYVDDLWTRGEAAARLRPEDLQAIRPGLEGYFDCWWEDQRHSWGPDAPLKEPAVQTLLSLLACALGPLNREDVLALAGKSELTTWTLGEALQPLARFVIGDGKTQGYVFGHPRLGEYFHGGLTGAERLVWEQRFLNWGKQTLARLEAGTLAPEETPIYVVQYYGAHLERQGGLAEPLFALVSDGWRWAWEALEGAYAGFLTDVERAWRAAGVVNGAEATKGCLVPHLGVEVHSALCRASVNSLAANIPPVLLAALVKQGVWTPAQGLAYARQVPEPGQRAEALTGLAPHLLEAECAEALREALAAAWAMESEWRQAEALAGLAPRLAELGHLQKALATTRAIQRSDHRAKALAGLAPYLPQPLLEEALAAARAIRDKYWRARALAGLAPYLPKALLWKALVAARAIGDERWRARALAGLAPRLAELGHPQEALAVARAIESEWRRAEALAGLSPHLPEAERVEVLGEALVTAQAIRDEDNRAEALAGLAFYLIESEREQVLEEALAAARAIRRSDHRAKALAGLAPRLAELGYPEEALAAARATWDERQWAEALAELAPHLPEAERAEVLGEALAAARAIKRSDHRAKALAELAPHLPEAERAEVLGEALAAARATWDERQRAETLVELTPWLAELDYPEEALVEMTTPWLAELSCLEETLVELAPRLAELGHPEEALAAAREIKSKWWRAEALVGLAPRLAGLGYPEEALAAAREIESEWRRAKALAGLAPHLTEPEREQALEEALSAAREIESEYERAKALLGLAPYLPEALLRETLTVAREIKSKGRRAEVLAGLASHLAQLPCQHLYPLWQETLPVLAARTRKDLLADLCALEPVIAALGGAQAVAETFRAIQDVGRWWP